MKGMDRLFDLPPLVLRAIDAGFALLFAAIWIETHDTRWLIWAGVCAVLCATNATARMQAGLRRASRSLACAIVLRGGAR